MRQQIPNLLTGLRLLTVPIALAIMLLLPDASALLLALFVIASLTDYLDGALARRWNVISAFGTLMDPVADKLLVTLMLMYLVMQSASHTPLIFLPAAVIILRELYISGLREFLAARQIALPVSSGGKWKTALQMLAIALLLAAPVFELQAVAQLGVVCLFVAALLALTSATQYTRISWKQFAPITTRS